MIPRSWLAPAFAAAVLLLAGASTASAQEGYVVIVNSANPTATLTREQAARLFLKKSVAWSNGQPAVPVDLTEDAPARSAFSKTVLGKGVGAVKSYWLQAIYSGGSPPPLEKATDGDVVAFVRANPNAIGYVSSAAVANGGVKVLALR
jgi:ABC-type phosphate transport system substrate-binding protein